MAHGTTIHINPCVEPKQAVSSNTATDYCNPEWHVQYFNPEGHVQGITSRKRNHRDNKCRLEIQRIDLRVLFSFTVPTKEQNDAVYRI